MTQNIFTQAELDKFEYIRANHTSELQDCVCCFFFSGEYILGSPSPSYGKIGTIAGKVENGESIIQAITREAQEEAGIQINPQELGDHVMSYEEINGACYQTHSFRCELPQGFVSTLPISSDNLESLPFLIHKDAIPLIEFFDLNPPNSRSLINWALGVEIIELQNLNQATEIQIAKFKEFLSSLEESMIVTKQRGLELLQTIAPEHLPKLNKKLKGVGDFEDKIVKIINAL